MAKVVTLGEIMLRLSPPGYERFAQASRFDVNYGGAEANVAASLAQLGNNAAFLSKIPKNAIGDAAIATLKSLGVNCQYIARGGKRLGIYFLENGASIRPSSVVYDRADSSVTQAKATEFDFDKIFNDNKNSRLIIATFASNVDRVQQIINSAVAYGRKVCVEGRSMVNIIEVAENLDYLKIPEGTLIDTEEMKNYPPEQIVLITTGSQGESMAALSRMAASLHRKVSIQPGDCVVFSSTPIPGNEKSVAKVINELGMKGAKVIFQDTHVSGHACQEEIKLIYSLVKPKYAIPVHGEYRHLCAQRDVVMALGYDKDHVFIAKSGDVIELSDDHGEIVGQVPTGAILVDGLGVGDVGNIVLRDRQNLAENGIIIVALTLEKYTGNLVAGPDIVTRGFVYVREAEELLDEAKAVVEDSVQGCLDKHISDWSKIKNIIKDDLSEYLWKKMKRNPVILPIIMEAQM